MALKYPSATGVWSNAANWNGGTLPVAGDDVRANGFAVTIDVDINVLQISTAQLLPAAAGGGFVVSTDRTLTCDCIVGTTTCLISSVGNTVNIIGNIYGGATGGAYGVLFNNSGSILNVTGNATGGSALNGSPHGLTSAGTVNFVGNAFAGVTNNAVIAGINITLTGNLTFTGNATCLGLRTFGIQCAGNGIFNGTTTGGNSTISGGINLTSGIHIVNSDCFGGSGSGSHGLIITNSTATVNGICYGGSVANSQAVIINTSTATFNGNIIGSATSAGALAVSVADNASNVVISQMTFGSLGSSPVNGYIKFKNIGPTITVLKADNTNQQLVDPSTTDIPVIGDVRDGVTYASGALTGTLKVPPATAVSVGVPTDNTVGTAVIDISSMGALLANYNV